MLKINTTNSLNYNNPKTVYHYNISIKDIWEKLRHFFTAVYTNVILLNFSTTKKIISIDHNKEDVIQSEQVPRVEHVNQSNTSIDRNKEDDTQIEQGPKVKHINESNTSIDPVNNSPLIDKKVIKRLRFNINYEDRIVIMISTIWMFSMYYIYISQYTYN